MNKVAGQMVIEYEKELDESHQVKKTMKILFVTINL